MSDKTKIKKMKLALVLTGEQRRALVDALSGSCECVVLEDVCFDCLEIEGVKADGLKDFCLELKHGKIKCFKVDAEDREDCC